MLSVSSNIIQTRSLRGPDGRVNRRLVCLSVFARISENKRHYSFFGWRFQPRRSSLLQACQGVERSQGHKADFA